MIPQQFYSFDDEKDFEESPGLLQKSPNTQCCPLGQYALDGPQWQMQIIEMNKARDDVIWIETVNCAKWDNYKKIMKADSTIIHTDYLKSLHRNFNNAWNNKAYSLVDKMRFVVDRL